MSSQLELVTNRFFGKNGLGITNFKFFTGKNRDATPEQMAEQINKAIAQINTQEATLISEYDD